MSDQIKSVRLMIKEYNYCGLNFACYVWFMCSLQFPTSLDNFPTPKPSSPFERFVYFSIVPGT